MHIDILVIQKGVWIPIELKYKTKKYECDIDGDFCLKNQGAQDLGRYLYLKDIERIEEIKDKVGKFKEGYTIFLTNDQSYQKSPLPEKDCKYKDFSLKDGTQKSGKLEWADGTSERITNSYKEINLKQTYEIKWKEFSKIKNPSAGVSEVFWYLLNKIQA